MQTHDTPRTQIENATAHVRGLIASEWQFMRREIAANLRRARTGLVLAVVGVVAVLCAGFALTATLFLGLAALGIAPWLAALITGGACSVIAALCLWLGLSRLSPSALAPTQSTSHVVETLRLVTEKTHVS